MLKNEQPRIQTVPRLALPGAAMCQDAPHITLSSRARVNKQHVILVTVMITYPLGHRALH